MLRHTYLDVDWLAFNGLPSILTCSRQGASIVGMENNAEKHQGFAEAWRNFVQWSITPPQSYAMYIICLVLVLGASYYAGTLNPKKKIGVAPQSISLPRN